MKEAEKKYKETIEQLYFAVRENNNWRKDEDLKYIILCDFSDVIGALYQSLDTLQGQRKINAENTFKTLSMVFDNLGKFYLDELKSKKDLVKCQESLIESAKELENLKAEIEFFNNINNF